MDIEGTCGSPRTPRTWSFHEKAVEEGRFYERRVAEDLSNKVFGQVFPDLARAIVEAAPQTDLREVRDDGALILLYRLLFILYAEDRDLLPVGEVRYDDCSLRKMRVEIGDRMDRSDVFSDSVSVSARCVGEVGTALQRRGAVSASVLRGPMSRVFLCLAGFLVMAGLAVLSTVPAHADPAEGDLRLRGDTSLAEGRWEIFHDNAGCSFRRSPVRLCRHVRDRGDFRLRRPG